MIDALRGNDFYMIVEVNGKPQVSRSYCGRPIKDGVKHCDHY